MDFEPKWLEWSKKLQGIAQAGLTYSKDKYDIERFEQIRDLSVEILNSYTNIDNKIIKDLFCNETGYPTPKIDVRAAIFKDDKVLLVKEKIDGLWSLPGGWADIDISLKEALIKETKEEAGVEVQPKRIIAIQDRKRHNKPPMPYGMYKIFVECTYVKGNFEDNTETSDAKFFSLEELPPLSLGRNTEEQIKMCYESRNQQFLEPLFD